MKEGQEKEEGKKEAKQFVSCWNEVWDCTDSHVFVQPIPVNEYRNPITPAMNKLKAEKSYDVPSVIRNVKRKAQPLINENIFMNMQLEQEKDDPSVANL